MTIRIQKIESTLTRALSRILSQDIADPRVGGLVSITRVQVSPDLHDAQVFVSVVPEKAGGRAVHALREAAGYVHGRLCKAVELKRVPRLDFRLDESLKRQSEVLGLMQKARERSPQDAGSPPELNENAGGLEDSEAKGPQT